MLLRLAVVLAAGGDGAVYPFGDAVNYGGVRGKTFGPVVGIVRDGKLLLDCLTLSDAEVDEVAAALA